MEHAVRLRVRLDDRTRLADVDGHHFHIRMRARELLDQRQRKFARFAPGRPKIEKHHMSALLRERKRRAR